MYRLILPAFALIFMATSSLRAEEPKKEEEKPKVETELVSIDSIKYPVPKTWKRQEPSSNMRLAQFGIPLAEGDEGKVELVVFYFGPGQGGSVDANMKRWLGQFKKLDDKEKQEKIEVDGLTITLLDAKGTYENKPFPMAPRGDLMENWRMLAAVVETDGQDGPYFFRAVGPAKTMEENKEHFMKMFKEAKAD